jgi:ribosomal protein L12E/L44/L45/RPP1/RPP2
MTTVYVIVERGEDDDEIVLRAAYRTEAAAQAEADALMEKYGESGDDGDDAEDDGEDEDEDEELGAWQAEVHEVKVVDH